MTDGGWAAAQPDRAVLMLAASRGLDEDDGLTVLVRHEPEYVLVTVVGEVDFAEVLEQRRVAHPSSAGRVEPEVLRKSLRNGDPEGPLLTRGHGYVMKVAPGELDLDRFERALDDGRRALADDESSAVLTGRESQILALIADGHTSREIADMLVISPRTVERHRENLRHKLGLRNRVDLTRYAIRAGLIAP